MRLTRSGERTAVEETDEISTGSGIGADDELSDLEVGRPELRSLRSERVSWSEMRDRHKVFYTLEIVVNFLKRVGRRIKRDVPRIRAYML
jgi:hypothetical protein